MNILICDDEEIYRNKERDICTDFFREDTDVQIMLCESGQDVMAFKESVDLLLLDIDMPDVDGISVKNILQREHPEATILFITNHEERVREAFGVHVMGFLDKRNMDRQIPMHLREFRESFYSYRWIEGENGERYKSSDIMYIAVAGKNYVRLCFKSGQDVLCRGSLKQLFKDLEAVDFIQPFRDYLVNMQEITKMNGDEILLGENKIRISVRNRKEIEKRYRDFQRRRMKYL